MFKFTIILKVTSIIGGIEFTGYPIVTRTTQTKDKGVVERAAIHRYIRENWGSISKVEIMRTSVHRIDGAA